MQKFNSTKKGIPAIEGDGEDVGIVGKAKDGWAISGESKKQVGVRGYCEDGWGVAGDSDNQIGVRGYCEPGWGVTGESKTGVGVRGVCDSYIGVSGESNSSTGVFGHSKFATAVHGKSDSTTNGAGVLGESIGGVGVYAISHSNEAVHGQTKSTAAAAVIGINESTGPGVRGVSHGFDGVSGESLAEDKAGVAGVNEHGIGVYGRGRLAGFFDGLVRVTKDIELVGGADCAEDFDIDGCDLVEPGTVMVVGENGALSPCQSAYDKRVAGVVSGAGDFKPAIVLDKQTTAINRQPIALLGKAYCKADASYGSIGVGDLLTSSPTQGYAMKAVDGLKAHGTIIGKALKPLDEGQDFIPILIALQ
jgi:hypothetical protein